MNDWSAGYVSDIGYTFGYYEELNPARTRLALLYAGIAPPQPGAHCELGFGQGVSVNIHAAASASEWHANDFNPAQAAFALEMARASGAPAHLHEEAFAEFCARKDLPDFETIGLHGIWTWISDEHRATIVDFVRRKLKPGGALYVSYNVMPGWAAMTPIRELMIAHANALSAPALGSPAKVEGALAFVERVFQSDPLFAKSMPNALERFNKLKDQNRSYLAHEYFNRHWLPMPITRMAEWLGPAKVDYACSASFLEHIDAINLTSAQQALLADIPDPVLRALTRDFCVNQQFRRDLWVRGRRQLSGSEQIDALREERIALAKAPQDVALKVTGALGEAAMQEAVYVPLLEALSDHAPHAIGRLEKALAGKVKFAQLMQATMMLASTGAIHIAQEPATVAKAKRHCDRLNLYISEKARSGDDLRYLASPLTGGAVALTRIERLFYLALQRGRKKAEDLADFAWSNIAFGGQRMVKDGKTLETSEENLAELREQAAAFHAQRAPALRALQIL